MAGRRTHLLSLSTQPSAPLAELHVINLSTGGPDFLDQPFVDKVNEAVARGIIVVSATGNTGPQYGYVRCPTHFAQHSYELGQYLLAWQDAAQPW